ncbi:MAG: Z1 domain-containing protein [Glaciecola sp.]
MDSYRFKYQSAIKDKFMEHIKTENYESLDKMRAELFAKIYDSVTIVADALGWTKIDKETFESYFEVVRKEIQANHITTINPPTILSKNKETWLTESKQKQIQWNYTSRYLEYLRGLGRSDSIVDEIESSSLKILSKLADPKSPSHTFVKGLVDGDVQSGKTGNFNAVINRSLDAGYKLIIVFSGIMDDLRTQTQARIDTDVIGDGKGVGLKQGFGHRGNEGVIQVVSITSEDTDFNRPLATAKFSLNQTNILVCKKNVGILKNILLWLNDNLPPDESKHSIPLLIIDDEADNASLNNEGHKGKNYASKVNGHIRAILGLFHKKSYLGYTATPFANVIQDRNDTSEEMWKIIDTSKGQNKEVSFELVNNLFPEDFIFLLETPTNYIGAHRIFETLQPSKKLPVVFSMDDYISEFPSRVLDNDGEVIGVERFDNKQSWDERVGKFGSYLSFATFQEYKRETRAAKSSDDFPNKLPEKLKDAVMCFIINIAIRETRRKALIDSKLYQRHNTMLVHVSRFMSWQDKTARLIAEYYDDLVTRLKSDKPDSPGSIYKKFERVWSDYCAEIVGSIHQFLPDDYFDEFMRPVSFDSLVPRLIEASDGIDVLALNSGTGSELGYSSTVGRKVIAIGGNRLSRGFTLEGLTISYFVRTTNYSDSLLQMGRWFGYRPGYLDCCKLFTSDELISKYDSTTLCIDELKDEFKKMDEKGATPREFELRVRKHPGFFQITRPSILKNTVSERWSYQDSLVMTTEFDVSKDKLQKVWSSFKEILVPLFEGATKKGTLLAKTVTADDIIEVLESDNNFDESRLKLLKQYIENCKKKNLLTSWTLAIKLTGNASLEKGFGLLKGTDTGLEHDIQMAVRKGPTKIKGNHFYDDFTNKQRFKASGASANIMSGGADMKVGLEDEVISEAEREFVDNKVKSILSKEPSLDKKEALSQAQKKTKPENIYREKLSKSQGTLIVYLFDPFYVFNQVKGEEHKEIKELLKEKNQTLTEPLVGLAIGFPPIARGLDPGGDYVKGDYDLDIISEEDNETIEQNLPLDAS